MDLRKETEILLRDAGYETWPWDGGPAAVVCFENDSIMGFAHFFGDAGKILDEWESAQNAVLARFRPALKAAGEKAWNVYSVFLTSASADDQSVILLDRIEENFSQTRKIARAGVQSPGGLRSAFLPILPIRNRPTIDKSNIEQRLEESLRKISSAGSRAFLKNAKPADIAQILAEE